MGWGFVGDVVGGVADAVVDVAGDVGGEVWDAATETVEAAVDVAGHAGGFAGSAFSLATDFTDLATGGAASWGLRQVDSYVFDTVDYVTAGTIDVDYDDSGFTASVGIDDVIQVGASIGERGIETSGETIGSELGFGLTDEGLDANVTAGINYGPLPYVDGHLDIDPNGDVSVNGEVQGVLPTPYGLVSGEVKGGFVRTDEGWGGYTEADGALYMPSGTTIRAGVDLAYQETEDGTFVGVAVEGSVSGVGLGTVGGSAGYTRAEADGVVVETASAEAYGTGFGASVEAGANYRGLEADGVSVSEWDTHVDAEGLDAESIVAISGAVLGAAGVDLPVDADSLVSALEEGNAAGLLGALADDQFGQFVNGLGGDAATQLVDKLAGDDAVGDFVESLSDDAAANLLGKVAGSGGLDQLVDGLDSDQTAALLGKVVSASMPPSAVAPDVDDVLGDVTGLESMDLAAGEAGIAPSSTFDPVGAPADAEASATGDIETDDLFDDVSMPEVSMPEVPLSDPVFDEPVAGVTEAIPDTDFDVAIEAADSVEGSLTDDLFDDLE